MPRYVKTPFSINHSVEETGETVTVRVSVTPYNGWFQEKKEVLDFTYAEKLLKEAGIRNQGCLNKEVKLNNKKKGSSTVEWVFAKKQPKKNTIVEKVLDKAPECVIMDREEVEVPVATKTKTGRKRRKPTTKTHKLLGDEDVDGVLV
jgi:hypothetical protein